VGPGGARFPPGSAVLSERRVDRTAWLILLSTAASGDLKRCTKCEKEKPREEFSRDRSRKDGRYPQCKACVRQWQQENAERLAEYHLRWQRENRDKQRAQNRAIASASAGTLSIGSDGEPTPAAAIGSGGPRTPTTWRADEPTTAAIGSDSEREPPTHVERQRRLSPVPPDTHEMGTVYVGSANGERCAERPHREGRRLTAAP
jgi:hypothetical protein